MDLPSDLKYSDKHIWARADGKRVTLGITAYAAEEMGDIIYLELPEMGAELEAGQTFGSVESAKAIEDLVAPIDGKVVALNGDAVDAPESVTEEPYGKGWLVVVEAAAPSQLDGMLSAPDYEAQLS
jgi:glycine cleavage system H protein